MATGDYSSFVGGFERLCLKWTSGEKRNLHKYLPCKRTITSNFMERSVIMRADSLKRGKPLDQLTGLIY